MLLENIRYYRAWDLPTRLFHWINVACVIALAAIGTGLLYDNELGLSASGKIALKSTHVWIGYVFAINLLVRLVWAFIGNRQARWSRIVPFKSGFFAECKQYLATLIKGETRQYVGHNPIARMMVTLMLAVLLTQAISGLVLAGTDLYLPPFGSYIAVWIAAPGADPSALVPYDKAGIDPVAWNAMRAFRSPFVLIHEWSFYFLLVTVPLHVTGVVVTEVREGGGIISAMVTGNKALKGPPVDGDDA